MKTQETAVCQCGLPVLWSRLRELWALPEAIVNTKEHATIAFVLLASMAHRFEGISANELSLGVFAWKVEHACAMGARIEFMNRRPGEDVPDCIKSLLVHHARLSRANVL